MSAIAYHQSALGRRAPVIGNRGAALRHDFAPTSLAPIVAFRPTRTIRPDVLRPARVPTSLAWMGTVAVLVAVFLVAGVIAGPRTPRYQVLPGSVATASGYLYTVQPGDTLWSIATRLAPSADPRALVAALEGQIHGDVVRVGEVLTVP